MSRREELPAKAVQGDGRFVGEIELDRQGHRATSRLQMISVKFHLLQLPSLLASCLSREIRGQFQSVGQKNLSESLQLGSAGRLCGLRYCPRQMNQHQSKDETWKPTTTSTPAVKG